MAQSLSVLDGWCRSYGPVFSVKLATQSVIVLNSPEYVQKLLGSTDSNHFDKGYAYAALKPYWKDGLVVSTGAKWKHHRRLLDKNMFSYKTLLGHMRIFNEDATLLVRSLGDNGGELIHELLKSASHNSIMKATLGKQVDFASSENGEMSLFEICLRAKQMIVKKVANPWLLFEPIWRLHPLSKVEDNISKLAWKYIRSYVAADDTDSIEENNNFPLKQELLAAGVSIEGVVEETATLLTAGSETTEIELQLLFYMLALHPQHQELCRNEIDALFGNKEESHLEYQELTQLKYLEMCLNETLRLFPAIFLIMRSLKAPLRLADDLELGVGTQVCMYFPGIHKNPEIYPNPEEFRPDRFSPEESQQRDQYAYLPFSAGPRKCIGFKFAIMQMMCITAQVLRHYVISTTGTIEDIKLLPFVTLTLETPLKFEFQRRKHIPLL
ncbi:Cytochrome P450 4C1 [Orchesella cincta]|uniref:Cytochrome P450 4C1 n=1 Tax=Orchesella cincta TaxID=48709 RepID=A0A1D2MDU1_ORCCI|nr:Cytochrome P450 4C1 [Orchesella cincta]